MEGNMSKKLVRILSICAFAVLVPLIILGVALSVAGNKSVTLSIFDGGNSVIDATTSKVAIFVDNKEQTSNKITVKKGTAVTVTWEGTGFTFNGWFEGNESEAQGKQAVSTEKSYTFNLNHDRVLTAIKHYVPYQINVQYKKNSSEKETIYYSREVDELGNVVGTFGAYSKASAREGYRFKGLEYNGNLYEVNAEGTDYTFGGSSLETVLLASETYSIDATAVWECLYNTFSFQLYAQYGTTNIVYGVDENGNETRLSDLRCTFAFNDTENGADLADDYYASLFGKYSKFIIKDGNNSEVIYDADNVSVTLNELTTPEDLDITLNGVTTVKELIDLVVSARGSELTDDDFVKITFSFKKA